MYKFLKLMKPLELRFLFADYGNATGAEINNFLVRDLLNKVKNNEQHFILDRLDGFLSRSSIIAIKKEVQPFMGDYEFEIDDEKVLSIIRENKNRIYQREAIEKGLTSFSGNCVKHGHGHFSIRGEYHFCNECYQTGMSRITFNPIRSLVFKLFVEKNDIKMSKLSKVINIPSGALWKYHKGETIPSHKWDVISKYIKGYEVE